ncbi:hypothetical protein [Roseobacter sp. S98]|uniref:hypothetical protein n=1 Tax=Roseobacter algicola (ex Choi et al. 2025) (nom. illeg.) TaxID=3092138 RepID=UPI0035C68BB6
MIHTFFSRYIGFAAFGCGLIATVIYVLMISVTLAHIEAVSGQVPFDMRPLGYRPKDAATLLETLGAEGREYYLRYQISLDTIYPAMLALTLTATLSWFGRRIPGTKLVRFGIVLSVGSALFDYFENLAIAAMIWSWPEVSIALVYAASTATIAKTALTTLAVLLALLTGFLWLRLPKADVCP